MTTYSCSWIGSFNIDRVESSGGRAVALRNTPAKISKPEWRVVDALPSC